MTLKKARRRAVDISSGNRAETATPKGIWSQLDEKNARNAKALDGFPISIEEKFFVHTAKDTGL
jgi:hypothetical protein